MRLRLTPARPALLSTALLALALAGQAEGGATGASKNVQAELIPEVEWVQPGTPFTLGIQLRMAPDWHTYWRNPGDAGLATRMRWALPEGFEAGPFQWPAPEAIPAEPLMSYGYSGEVVLLTELRPPAGLAPGTTVKLGGRLDWLECKDVCLPGRAQLEIELPVRSEPPATRADRQALFAATRGRLPQDGSAWRARLLQSGAKLALTFEPQAEPVEAATFFPESQRVIDHPALQRLLRTAQGLSLELARASDAEALGRVAGVLVIEAPGPRRALALTLPVESVAALPAGTVVTRRADARPARSLAGLLPALGFAFLGGLILNLMPCVLPVLSLKVLGFVRHAGGEPGRAWRHGLAFAAGVVLSFWALAGLLLALRAAGQQIGWGFQLQSPGFVAALSFLFFLIGLNLLGVFEVGTSLTRLGDAGSGPGLGSSFSSGALATVVATPCTAPFMGSALGFGLSQPAPVALAVFTSLAVGMAAPYLLLSLSPRLLRFVPKPGAWMEAFKQAMGFVMMGTVVVLVWIYGRQAGNDAVAWLLGGLVLLGLGAWIYGRATAPGHEGPHGFSLALAALCAALGLALGLSQARAAVPLTNGAAVVEGGIAWQPWSPEAEAAARGAGQAVFVDFTAAWCLSCQVNERVALRAPAVAERFARHGVTALKADWTLQDERITSALRGFGRSGVPLYVLYPPGGEAHLLPEVITPDVVLRAFDEALGAPRQAATTAPTGAPSRED